MVFDTALDPSTFAVPIVLLLSFFLSFESFGKIEKKCHEAHEGTSKKKSALYELLFVLANQTDSIALQNLEKSTGSHKNK